MSAPATICLRFFVCLALLFVQILRAQDSSEVKPGIRLFDVQLGMGFGRGDYASVDNQNIGNYTKHKEYVSENFMADYSDTTKFDYRRRHPTLNLKVDAEIALNTTFQFHDCDLKLLRRLKPRIGINYYHATLFRYELGLRKSRGADTLYYVNPNYPPVIVDSIEEGHLNYSFSINRLSLELGANFDFLTTRTVIVYGGFVYGYGLGTGRFSVRKDDSNSTINEELKESTNYTTRYSFPLGILLRAGKREKKNINLFAELRPGFYIFKTDEGVNMKGSIFTFNLGIRLSLHPNR